MSGVKGRSGRGTHRSDVIRNEVIQKSWELAQQYLNDTSIATKDKLDLIARIVTKAMPTQIEGEKPETQLIIIRSEDKKTNSIVEHKIAGGREISVD